MPFDPEQCRVLLVGKLMARLEPFLQSRGYPRVESEEHGSQALTRLASESYHLVLLELNLGDIALRDFFLAAKAKQPDASFLLFASPADAEMVVSGLVLGADTYVPLPPDEAELFSVLERQGAAALSRKIANPDAQPGVSAKVSELEEALAAARAELEDAAERARLLDAETARLSKLLEEAKRAAAQRPAEQVPPGHKLMAMAALEELESRATFAEFLESENDELKRERDALLVRLRSLGLVDDESEDGDAFEEPTSAIHIDDEALDYGQPRPAADPSLLAADTDDGEDMEGEELLLEDDGVELLLHEDDSDVVELASADDSLLLDPFQDPPLTDSEPRSAEQGGSDVSEEIDLAALEELVADRKPATPKRPAAPRGAVPSPGPPPAAVPPPTGDEDEDFEDFDDVNTDALLRLAKDLTGTGSSPDQLQKLLEALDEDG